MKKLLFIFGILFVLTSQAQKIAFVDTDKILEKIPDYQSAQDKLNDLAVQYQKEIQDPTNVDYSLNGLVDQSESEITWIKLHQMFDK